MKSIGDLIKRTPWYCWILTFFAVIYIIYISLSFFYLPGKLKSVTETDVSKMIGRDISVEKISFNPFFLSLTVKNLSVSDKPDRPLIGWDRLYVNFSFWKSLFLWGAAFDQITLEDPRINIVSNKEGFNFSDIIERLSAPAPDKNPPDENKKGHGKISLKIFNTSINRGKVSFDDLSGNIPASINMKDVSVSVDKLYLATGDEHLNPFSLRADGPKGSKIELTGNYRIDPLDVEASIRADGIELSSFSSFLENIIPAGLRSGKLSFSSNIRAKKDTDLVLKTDKGDLSITGLIVDDNIPEPPMLSAGNLNVKDFSLDITGRKVMVERVILDRVITNQWIDKNGKPRYEGLLSNGGSRDNTGEVRTPVKEEEKPAAPWDVMIKQVALENSTINFRDLNEKITVSHSLSGINLDIKDISLAPETNALIRFSAVLDEKGNITAGGSMCPTPFSTDLKFNLDKILLKPFSEYLEDVSWLDIEDGRLSVEGKVSVGRDKESGLSASANLGIDDFKLKDIRSGNPVFGFREFKLDGINVDMNRKNVSIASVNISGPDVDLLISEKKKLNLAGLMKEKKAAPAAKVKAEGAGKDHGWNYEINKVSLNEGTVLFSDKSIKPAFRAGLYNIAFSLDRIGSGIKKTAPFSFNSEIDKYAPFTIKGSLDPIDKQPGFTLKSELKGFEMPQLSPYSDIYIGNDLKSGNLTLNLEYSLHNSKLKGENNINAKNLYLGERVPVKPVIDAPVGLGLALLRDLSGVIDLNVGVSGNLDDPGFSVSGVIIKALVNIIVKAAASPFKLLGALIPGGGGEDLGNVTFDPGSSALNQKNKADLKNLVDALKKRPQLVLSVKGNASGPEDVKAIEISQLKKQVAEKRGIPLSKLEEELKLQDLWDIAENRPALEAINNEMGLTPVSERLAKQSQETGTENATSPQASETQDKTRSEQAVYKEVYDDILASEKVDEEKLLALAEARAISIMQYLVDDLKLSPDRVSVIKAAQSDLSGRVVELGVDVQ